MMDQFVSPIKKRSIGRGLLTKKALDKLESMKVAEASNPGSRSTFQSFGSVNCTQSVHFDSMTKFEPSHSERFSHDVPCNLDLNANILETKVFAGHKEQDKNIPVEDCSFCNRPPKMIVCRACGDTLAGRVRGLCESHPTVVHLMDIDCCPSCKGMSLKEFS